MASLETTAEERARWVPTTTPGGDRTSLGRAACDIDYLLAKLAALRRAHTYIEAHVPTTIEGTFPRDGDDLLDAMYEAQAALEKSAGETLPSPAEIEAMAKRLDEQAISQHSYSSGTTPVEDYLGSQAAALLRGFLPK
jgi:hypothetical protein